MNFEEYASSRHALYQRLAEVIETILGHALKECDGIGNRPQTQSRPKETSSLQRKLADRGLLESDMIETKIKDLAGCRIIFYTNADLERFRQSGITNGQIRARDPASTL